MDKVFKKIIEGLEIFDTLYERHESATSSSQKEKLENDLKKEIKKLQRFREQVKNWQAANEIKDKDQLLEHRRLVEVAMEKYKIVEKGSKTKAYSDQSLATADKPEIDNEAIEFVRQSLDSLQQQIESLEAEVERLQPSKKGKKNIQNESQKQELEELLASHQWHTEKLEIVLRLLQNEVLSVDEVMQISDDITYYLDENRSPDFMFDDTIYDELDLEADQTLINDIHVLPEESINNDTDESSPIPKAVSKSHSVQPTSGSNSTSRSNSTPIKAVPNNVIPTGIISNNNNVTQEKPPVIQAIGTSSNNQATVTTLKPAPVPALASEMTWSSVVKKKDAVPSTSILNAASSSSQPKPPASAPSIITDTSSMISPDISAQQPSSSSLVNTNAVNAASVLEALKKQKPKDSSISPSTITPISSLNQVPASAPATTSEVSSSAIAAATESMNASIDAPEVKPLISDINNNSNNKPRSIGLTKTEELASSSEGFRFLPPGIQSFIFSICSNKDLTTTTYNPFQSINHTPSRSYPAGLKGIHLAEAWNKISVSKDLKAAISTLEVESLFYGYYFGRSAEERDITLNALTEKGWKKSKLKHEWFLSNSVISKGDNWSIEAVTIFNVDNWSISERKNTKVEANEFV